MEGGGGGGGSASPLAPSGLPFLAIETVTSGPAFEFVVVVLLQKSTHQRLNFSPKHFAKE